MARTRHALGHAQRGYAHLHTIAGGEGRQLFKGEAHEGRTHRTGERGKRLLHLRAIQQVAVQQVLASGVRIRRLAGCRTLFLKESTHFAYRRHARFLAGLTPNRHD